MNSRALEIGDIASHEGEVVDERDGGDLLVERVAWVGNSQMAPDLRRVRIESENAFAERFDDGSPAKPRDSRACSASPRRRMQFDATAQLADAR